MTHCVQTPDSRIIWPFGHRPDSAVVYAKNIVDVSAEPESVWSILIDCVQWPAWYRHCSDVSILLGGPILGPGAKFRFKTLGFYGQPEITTFQPAQMLVWFARGPAGLGGAHAWLIEPTSGGCRVTTEEVQTGRLLFFFRSYMRRTLLEFHCEWLRALKDQAESK